MSNTGQGIANQSRDHDGLLVRLKEAQNETGYLSEEVMAELAKSFGMSISDVYGAATFYSFLATKPRGRNVIKICQSLPCYLKNYLTIAESVKREIGIKPGETTPDGRFSFTFTNCIGACDQAPAMLINDDVHGNLTPEKISQILKAYQ